MTGISLVVPLYNKAACIDSLAEALCKFFQSFSRIIIVDDCSTDNGLARLRALTSHLLNVEYIELNENMGPFEARLKGIRAAQTPWVQLLDADDELVNVANDSDISSLFNFDPMPLAVAYKSDLVRKRIVSEWLIPFIGWPNSSSIIVWRDACLDIVERDRLSWGEDHVFFASLLAKGRIFYFPGTLAHYRREYAERSILNGSFRNRIQCAKGIFFALVGRSVISAVSLSVFFSIRSIAAYVLKKVVR